MVWNRNFRIPRSEKCLKRYGRNPFFISGFRYFSIGNGLLGKCRCQSFASDYWWWSCSHFILSKEINGATEQVVNVWSRIIRRIQFSFTLDWTAIYLIESRNTTLYVDHKPFVNAFRIPNIAKTDKQQSYWTAAAARNTMEEPQMTRRMNQNTSSIVAVRTRREREREVSETMEHVSTKVTYLYT